MGNFFYCELSLGTVNTVPINFWQIYFLAWITTTDPIRCQEKTIFS
jgi:hypothetical protein